MFFGQLCMKRGLFSQFLLNFRTPPHYPIFSAKLPIVGWPMLLQILWCKKIVIWIKTELIELISVKLWDKRGIWEKVAKKNVISTLHTLCDYPITDKTFVNSHNRNY
ncbi:unnamed protein product [Meganyctiphanes norvegica]|uniref:Uncharacterized protein n=1 Tax=Meganyctiphanes norvegica TaxID=48144 RepID=A0AAV2R8F9_MEGNR